MAKYHKCVLSERSFRSGIADKAWQREECTHSTGSGFRAPAKTWKKGISGKQNKFPEPLLGYDSSTVINTSLYHILHP